jgi:hypothetical protein
MTRWLFDSKGQGVAFVVNDNVFDQNGKFIGVLKGHEIWNESYIAEIVKDDRLATKSMKPLGVSSIPPLPSVSNIPSIPPIKSSTIFPTGFKDVGFGQ